MRSWSRLAAAIADVGGHSFELTLRKKDRIVETRKPEGRRAIKEIWLIERGVCFCASDLEASDPKVVPSAR